MRLLALTLMTQALLALVLVGCRAESSTDTRPNIVWIVGEDLGPELGCYGDSNAVTPNLDRLAREGVRFTRAFTHAPVCAPSRSGLVTGRYPTSIGTHHMRSRLLSPPPLFTDYLRKAGYEICWPTRTPFGKTDFNFALPAGSFDVVTDWTREIPQGRPFFGFFNIETSHESQIRAPASQMRKNLASLSSGQRHDPNRLRVPAYHPDTPIVRRDLANYCDLVTAVDHKVGEVLSAIERAGVADRTAVFFTGDHGRGLPRSKRWVYDSGIHVPLIVRWPGKIAAGSVRNDLVCFLDLPDTALALAGVDIPREFQGRVVLGPKTGPAPRYLFAARDRMDETFDRIRSVRGDRFHYLRNFHPELPYGQPIAYAEEMPTLKEWRRLHEEGKLNVIQDAFFAPTKPAEELYDSENDPDEVHNLAGDARYRVILEEYRRALDRWAESTGDQGAIPEGELIRRGILAGQSK